MRSKKEFLYVFASVLLSFILFINASSFNFQNNSSARQVSSETYTNTFDQYSTDAKYNDKKYFVSGLTSEVTVFLKGSKPGRSSKRNATGNSEVSRGSGSS